MPPKRNLQPLLSRQYRYLPRVFHRRTLRLTPLLALMPTSTLHRLRTTQHSDWLPRMTSSSSKRHRRSLWAANQVLDEPQEAKPDGFDYYAISINRLQLDEGKQLPRALLEARPQIRWLISNGVVQLIMNPPAEGYLAGPEDSWNVKRDNSSRILARPADCRPPSW